MTDWIVAMLAGSIVGLAIGFCGRLFKRLRGGSTVPTETELAGKVYLEPSRAQEILREIEKKKQHTLKEIDSRYSDRRRDFLEYLDGQREAIIRDLHQRQSQPPPPDPPGGGKKGP